MLYNLKSLNGPTESGIEKTDIRWTFKKMREDLPGKFFKRTPIKIIRKLSDDTKKLLTEEVNKSVEHNLNSNFKVITKRIHDLKVLEK